MARGILNLKSRSDYQNILCDEQLHYFLDRFYTSRISLGLLIHNHILLFGPHLQEQRLIGCIDPQCNVREVILDAYRTASHVCQLHFERPAPELKVKIIDALNKTPKRDSNGLNIVYVPTHLHHMIFELLKNAMRATMEYTLEKRLEVPSDIDVLVVGGKEDVSIKISDHGGGIPKSMISEIFKYTFTTAMRNPEDDESGTAVKLAGYGYGLPLSRLYARYLSGDLTVSSCEGFGTHAYIFLKRQESEAGENVPVYNRQTANRYHNLRKERESDWVESKDESVNTSTTAASAKQHTNSLKTPDWVPSPLAGGI